LFDSPVALALGGLLGQGDYQYEVVDNWAKVPEGWDFSLVSDAAIDLRVAHVVGPRLL
jgi:hypothetical protein